jgi:hypothetical protein
MLTVAVALAAVGVATLHAGDVAGATAAPAPVAHVASTCADYSNQKAAQEVADTGRVR